MIRIAVNFSQLKFVKATSEFKSFSKAAQFCHVTQPTLSSDFLQLEDGFYRIIITNTSTTCVSADKTIEVDFKPTLPIIKIESFLDDISCDDLAGLGEARVFVDEDGSGTVNGQDQDAVKYMFTWKNQGGGDITGQATVNSEFEIMGLSHVDSDFIVTVLNTETGCTATLLVDIDDDSFTPDTARRYRTAPPRARR